MQTIVTTRRASTPAAFEGMRVFERGTLSSGRVESPNAMIRPLGVMGQHRFDEKGFLALKGAWLSDRL